MTHPSPSLLDAIAEVCKWHGLVQSRHPSRVLRDGGRQEILPPEIPQAIRNGEIPVPEELRANLAGASKAASAKDPEIRELVIRNIEAEYDAPPGSAEGFRGETCRHCGRPYSLTYWVPDDLWKRVSLVAGFENGMGTLCIECFTHLALSVGISPYWTCGNGAYPGCPPFEIFYEDEAK